jgi:hypothetical protein
MATNKVAFEVVVTSKGFKVVQTQQGKLAKSIDKTDKSTKNLDKTQQKNYGRQKQGLIQTANGTKNFSKLSQTINGGGGTSLVGAYATLAANIFAASAAFNALSRAADFQKLREGLEIIGNQSGRSLGILAENLREATGMALTLEEASSAAALGISGGFGGAELTQLAKVAKGAATTLGRSLPDAFDRLTRGAIKLEPEILDELGIMVRLDDAVEKYAAQLGKGVNSLTQMERRQAFMNEILEQGAAKFGEIADATDSTAYAKLGATFGDLTTDIFSFINESAGLKYIVDLLAGSTTALMGTMIIFGSTIATQIIPALGNMAAKSSERAAGLAQEAKALQSSAKLEQKVLTKQVKGFKMGAASYTNAKKMEGTATQKLEARIKSLTKSQKLRQANITKGFKGDKLKLELKRQELILIDKQIAKETKLLNLQKGGGKIGVGAALAKADAKFAKKGAELTQKFTGGEIGLGAALSANFKNWDNTGKKKADALKSSGRLAKMNGKLGSTFKLLGSSIGLLFAGFVKFLPLIGAVTVAIGIAILAFNKFYNTEERKAYNKSMKDLKTILDSLPKKAEAYNKALKAAGPASLAQIKETAILSNSIKEMNLQLKEAVANRKKLTDAGKSDDSITELSKSDKLTLEGGTKGKGSLAYSIAAEEPVVALEKLLGKEIPIIASKAEAALSGFLRIDESPEFDTLKTMLNSEIPGYAKFAADNMGRITDLLAKDDLTGALQEISVVTQEGEVRFGKLGSAVAGFAMSLKDSEKIGSQFIQKFLPKTATSDILQTFAGFKNEIKSIKEEAARAEGLDFGPNGETPNIGATAAQFGSAGSAMTSLLGGDFKAQQKLFNEAKKVQDEAKKAADANINPEKQGALNEALATATNATKAEGVKLETTGTKAINATFEVLKDVQTAELTKKKTLERINGLRKIEKGLLGQSTGAYMIQNKSLDDTVSLRKADFNLANDLLGKELGLTKAQRERGEIMANLLDKQAQTGDNALTQSEQASIELQLQEQKNIALQEQLNIGQKAFNQANAILAVDKLALKLLEKQTAFQNKARKMQIANDSARSGRKTTDPITALRDSLKVEEARLAIAKKKAEIELESARIQNALLVSQLTAFKKMMGVDNKEGSASFIDFDQLIIDSKATFSELSTELTNQINNGGAVGVDLLAKHFQNTFGKDLISDSLSKAITAAFLKSTGTIDTLNEKLLVGADSMRSFGDSMVEIFGEQGAVIGALSNFVATLAEVGPKLSESFAAIETAQQSTTLLNEDGVKVTTEGISAQEASLLKFAAAAQAVGGVIAGFAQVMAADSKQKVAAVDQQIEAEKRLDGKSAQSLAKIAAMEKKKETIQRKAFETNKKLQIAQAIISTASGAAMALTLGPILGPILAGMIVALGMAQVAMIKKTTFQGGASEVSAPNTALNIGGRSNSVDVARGPSSGELAYLRGGSGSGTSANDFTPGGAMGRKGYADGGMLVGERGPEVVTKEEIIPNYALGKGGTTNVNFTISAVDGQSVQNMLNDQQGNIIQMIRDAANDNGEGFLESVDPTVYNGSGG